MKNISKLVSALCLCASVVLFSGCASTQSGGNDTLARIQSASKVAAYIGASEYMRSHPETRPAFETAVQDLNIIADAEHVDFATLLAIVQRLPIKEIKNERATMFVTAATILLSDYAGSLPIDKLDNLKPVAKSIASGIQLALSQ